MGEIVWCVGRYFPDGHCQLVRDMYAAVVKYDNEEDAMKLAQALRNRGFFCWPVPVDLAAENI